MSGFSHVDKIIVPLKSIEFIYQHLRDAGSHGMEGIGLLYGKLKVDHFTVTNTIIPRHTAYKSQNGLLYFVDGDELHRINKWAYQNKVSLIAQIHSHPSEAFHSDTDNEYPIVTTVGGFSIVIPHFAYGPIDTELWEVYRLFDKSGWTHLTKSEVSKIFEIN